MKRIMSILLVLSILLVGCSGSSMSPAVSNTAPDWWRSSNPLANIVPIPSMKNGEIIMDAQDYYFVDIPESNLKEFNKYVDACIEHGLSNYDGRSDIIFWGTTDDGQVSYSIGFEESSSDLYIRLARVTD